MAWVISALGAALALAGGFALWNGSEYIRLEEGQAETVAGTVALSAGVVTIAIAAVLFALRDLARPLRRQPARAAASGVGLDALHLPEVDEGAEWSEPAQAAPTLVRDLDGYSASPQPSRDAGPAFPMPDRHDAPLPAGPALAEAPTVVGRYEANGASYVLFSDGTIEVETESGTHSFASMADLKDHIERQDAG